MVTRFTAQPISVLKALYYYVAPKYRGKPNTLVSHSWDGMLHHVLRAVEQSAADIDENGDIMIVDDSRAVIVLDRTDTRNPAEEDPHPAPLLEASIPPLNPNNITVPLRVLMSRVFKYLRAT